MKINGQVEGSDGKARGLSVALVCSFLANAPGGVTLDGGKKIPQIRKGWKATDAEKVEAQAIFGKLTAPQKAEIVEGFTPAIEKFLAERKAKNELWKAHQSGSLGKGFYR